LAPSRESISRRTQQAFLWIALVPVILAAVGWWSARDYEQRLDWVRHTREVLLSLDKLTLTITDAETSQRGYLLTGDETYLAGYRTALETLDAQLERIQTLVSDSPAEKASADELQQAARAKLNELRRTVEMAQAGGRTQALEIVAAGRGQRLMQQIRAVAATMTTREQDLLSRRISEQTDYRRDVAAIFISAILLTFVLLVWAQRLISKFAHQREVAEDEVRRLNAGLEQRVAEQTASLREANENLRRSNEDLERFAWVATHDLQEPLRMVSSYVGLLGRKYQGRLDADADTYIGFAADGARKMRELINDLLSYVRAVVERPRFSTVDCERLLQQVLVEEHQRIQESGAVITHDPLPEIVSDRERLSTVFRHLVDNAIKFRKPEEAPRIHVGARREDGEWRVCFRDEGIGFDQRYAERILVIFQKLHAPDKFPGTGLGLAVSRRIIEGLGGRLWAESETGNGATFWFTLPQVDLADVVSASAADSY